MRKETVLWLAALSITACGTEVEPPSDALITKAVEQSDDFKKYRYTFVHAARELIREGECKLDDFIELGGWTSSPKSYDLFFVYCGGSNTNNRIYLNVSEGTTFR